MLKTNNIYKCRQPLYENRIPSDEFFQGCSAADEQGVVIDENQI
jgi:hypothetical protein